MAKYDPNQIQNKVGGITSKYSTNVLTALLDDTNLLDITKNRDLQTLILKTSGELLSLIKIPDDSPIKSALPKRTLSEEEKLYDLDPIDGELNKQETKNKLIGDFKNQLEKTVLGKFNLTTKELVDFKNAPKEERNVFLKKYIEENPKYQSISGSIDTKVNLYSSLIDKQLSAGKELFDLVKSNDRIYVSGIVVDEITGDPIKGAQVEFSSPNFDPINAFKDITNKKGKFTIEIPSASFNDPLAELTPEEIEQGNKGTSLLFLDQSLLPTQSSNVVLPTNNFPFDINITNNTQVTTPVTNNPKFIPFSGSVYLPEPFVDEPDDPVVQTTLTGSDSGSIQILPPQPDLSGYTLYVAKDENGTPVQPSIFGNTDLSGSFNFSIPDNIEYITLSKGSGTSAVLYTTFNIAEFNLEEPLNIEIPNLQSDSETLSNTTIQTATTSNSSLANDTITVKATNYTTGNFPPYKGNGRVKDKVVIKLTPIAKTLEEEKINALLPNPVTTQELTKNKKDAKWYQNEKLAKVSRELSSTMLPVVLTMAASFGVSKLGEKIEKGKGKIDDILKEVSCPTTPEGEISKATILNIIAKKNKLVKQLNNTLKIIDNTTKALGIAATSIEIMNASYMILKNIPIPTSTGVPGVPGLPINVINTIEDTKIKIDKAIASLRGFNLGLLATLVVLRQTLIKIIAYLNALDGMIQFCSPDEAQEQISAELLALTVQQTEQTSPVVINVNGFSLAIETEPTTNPLKRRRAIAKNKSNITMLQGEWSFSSIDQILMDELVFYIQVNNLKAD